MFLLRSVFSGFADLICKNLSIKKHSIEQRNSTFPITLLHTAMGATASRSDKILQNDIETFEASMLLTKRPIMWGDEGSVAAHSALNSLRNAQYHILSGRRGRGLRVAAASKFNCTGRVTSQRVVSFGALAVDITLCECSPLKLSDPLRLVGTGTGQCAPVTSKLAEPACDVINCSAVQSHCGAIMRASSSSSSVCSLDDTLPRIERREPASWHAHCKACHKSSHQLSLDLEAAQVCPFEQESEETFDLCDILTSGGRPAPSKAHEDSLCHSLDCAHEIGAHEEFDISDILTSGGRCLGHQATRSRSGTF